MLLRRLDILLHHPAHPPELVEERRAIGRLGGQGRPRERRGDLAVGRRGIGEDGIALAGEALVQLHHRPADSRPLPPQLFERLDDVLFRVQVFETGRARHARLLEHAAATRLGAVVLEVGVEPVQGDAEQHRELPLEPRGVEDGEIGPCRVGNRLADPLDQAGPLHDLLAERPRRPVVAAQHRQPRARVSGRHARQQIEVVVQDDRVHRLRGDIHQVRPGVAEADQEEQQPLFVIGDAGDKVRLCETRLADAAPAG